jgi:hypothetical protein
LLAINGLFAVLFVVSRLEQTQVAMLGPPGQYVYELFNPPRVPETSELGKRLIADVKALGGHADIVGRSRPVSARIRRFTRERAGRCNQPTRRQ